MRVKKNAIKNSTVGPKKKKNFTAIFLAGFAIIAITAGIAFTLSKLFATETYYVLNTDIPSKTQITKAMLIPQETAKGTAPQNAIGMGDIQRGTLFSKYPLFQGDVLASSNAGEVSNSFDGIPDDWVVISFTASADNAVDGKIMRGDYFDVIGVNPSEVVANPEDEAGSTGGRYLITDVLALDINSSSAGEAQTDAEGNVTTNNSGASLVYTVGMPQKSASGFLGALPNYDEIHLARSPISVNYKDRNVKELAGLSQLPGTEDPQNLYAGTDSTFSPIIRDKNSVPVNKATCEAGMIEDSSLCKINGFKETKFKPTERQSDDDNKAYPFNKEDVDPSGKMK